MNYPVIDPVATGARINTFRINTTLDNFLALSVLLGVSINDLIVYH